MLTRDIKRIRCGRNGDAKRNQIKITGWAGLCIVMVGPFLSMVAVIIDIDGMSVLETENDSIVLINALARQVQACEIYRKTRSQRYVCRDGPT